MKSTVIPYNRIISYRRNKYGLSTSCPYGCGADKPVKVGSVVCGKCQFNRKTTNTKRGGWSGTVECSYKEPVHG